MDPISPGMLRNGFTGENPKLQACVSGKVFMFSEVSRFPNCQPIFQRFVFTRVCMCVEVPVGVRRGCQIPGAGVMDRCELPSMSAGNQTQVLLKSRTCS